MTIPHKIAGLGELLWDIYDDRRHAGGAPANFALHARRCGADALLLSRVGDDQAGRDLKALLARNGVDVSAIQTSPDKPTGSVRVHLGPAGAPRFECSRDTAFDQLECDQVWRTLLPSLDALLYGVLAQREETSRNAIRACLHHADKALRLFDLNLRGWNDSTRDIVLNSLSMCDIVKMNETELAILQQALAAGKMDRQDFLHSLLHSYNIKMAAVTLGSRGCWLLTPDQNLHHPGFPVRAVDTTGCGDAFAAGLIWSILNKASLEEMAEFANRLGAFVATRQGAMPEWSQDDLAALGEA
ncbi:MAG TPA: carbohydrate kinase [bacterium]|nr:carbohydrate kinase [bacterium]